MAVAIVLRPHICDSRHSKWEEEALTGQVDAFRDGTSLDAELKAFARGALFGDVARHSRGECQVPTDLAEGKKSINTPKELEYKDTATGTLVLAPP